MGPSREPDTSPGAQEHPVAWGSLTCDDFRVNVEGVVGWVDLPFAVVLLAQHEGRPVPAALPMHVGVAPDCLVRDGQVLGKEETSPSCPRAYVGSASP